MSTLQLIELFQTPILKQLQIEEALLRTDSGNFCLVNHGSSPAIVMGISGKKEKLIHPNFLKTMPFPLIRRFSGGGTVVINKDTLFITFICNKKDVAISPFPESVLAWTGEIYKNLFSDSFFRVRENDYVMGDKKFGGNAQYFCKDRWLHHTSFLWDYAPKEMEFLLLPEKMPTYREKRRHVDFLCKMKDFVPCKYDFITHFKETLNQFFHVQEQTPEILEEMVLRPHRKSTALVCDE